MARRKKAKRGGKLRWLLGAGVTLVVAVAVAVYALLASLDVQSYRSVIEDQAKQATGRDLKIAGAMDLKISLKPTIILGDVSLANASWGSAPEMLRLKHLEVQVDLLPLISGDIEIDHITLVQPDVLLETNAEGQGNWVFAEDTTSSSTASSTSSTATVPSIHEVRIEQGQITYRDGKTKESHAVAIDTATLKGETRGGPLNLDLAFRYRDQPITLSGTTGSVDSLKTGPFDFNLQASSGEAAAKLVGVVAKPIELKGLSSHIELTADSLAALGALAGVELPSLGPVQLATQAVASDDLKAVTLSGLSAKLAESDLSGKLDVSLQNKVPQIDGSLSSQRLDLDAIAAAFGGGEPSGESEQSKYLFEDTPLPLDLLSLVNTKLTYEAALLRLPSGIEIANLKTQIALSDEHLQVDPTTGKLADGDLALSLDLDGSADPPPLQVKGQVRQMDYGKMLRTLKFEDGFEGLVDMDLDLRGKGGSPRTLVSTLNGNLDFINNGGSYRGGGPLTAAVTGLTDILQPFSKSESIKVNCMVVRFDAKDGLATAKALLIDWQPVILYGGGAADFRDETLDFTIKSETRDVSLTSFAVPFDIGGTFLKPRASINTLGAIEGVAKLAAGIAIPIYGIPALLAEKELNASGNRCLQATESAQTGTSEEKGTLEKAGDSIDEAAEGVGKALDDAGEGISKGFKSLFGD